MPCLKDPAAESLRMAAVRVALARVKPWQFSKGARTAEGKRRAAGNALRHGLDSLAVKWALRYIAAVERTLKDN